ncbi:hypothetical protein ASL14_15005 [Paenibacillus sp. IHB B 3084]|uniref:hypothetical protein n=1 Tax=Paenibacillus sp. IHB B 3084 TaxID=867076 RepID=UPI00071FED57|nr:hypothetical protein [Paenibacillus sp. IHB B 3084]ALP37307.1 hypothetical protein ASL14_15005 [Paenibacillus sp. IHB B 3084]
MKKAILALSISALALSLGGVASASSVESINQIQSSAVKVSSATVTVTFEPANGEKLPIKPQKDVPLGMGSEYYMDGSNWMILYGSNVVSLSGNKVTIIGYGTAQVKAFKSNGAELGVYTFIVKR